MKKRYSQKKIKKISNKGLLIGLGISSPMLVLTFYFIYKDPFLINWAAVIGGIPVLIICWVCILIWKRKTNFKENIAEIKKYPSDTIYDLFAYSGFTFLFAFLFSIVFPLGGIILMIVGFWQLFYVKNLIDNELLIVLKNSQKKKMK